MEEAAVPTDHGQATGELYHLRLVKRCFVKQDIKE